jgi:hypothetical protein
MNDVYWQHELREATCYGSADDIELDATRPTSENPTPYGYDVSASIQGAWQVASISMIFANNVLIVWKRLLVEIDDPKRMDP